MFRRNESRLASKISLTLVFALLFSGTILTSHTTSANDTHVDDVSIIVPISCNLVGTNTTHSATINPGTTTEDIGKTTLKAFCNDNNGFAIYAIGYTNDTNGTTTLVGDDTDLTIPTSTNTSGSSSWSMKLSKETNSSQAYQPNNLTIVSPYTNYAVVPTNWTKVATFSSATDNTLGAVLYTTYKVHIASGQAADSYNGKVKYTLFHPSTSCLYYTVKFNPGYGTGAMVDQPICSNGSTALSTNTFTPPAGYEFKEWNTKQDGTGTSYSNEQIINTNLANIGESITLYAIWGRSLYSTVASLSKGTLAQNNVALTDTITTPTSTNKDQDTSNSGVYTYDPAVYGVASDASNDYPIYFYRGILETNPVEPGSLGSANAYPNYVKLGNNTCWRIIRTTGSGGIKMIYSGIYGATTSGSCANNGAGIALSASKFVNNSTDSFSKNKHLVGYTYNSSMNGVTTSTSVDTVFGSDSNPSLNNTRSTIKTYIEDTWYVNNMTSYTNMLEASAGYCNDRSMDKTSVVPYQNSSSSGSTVRYGAYYRNIADNGAPSLTCPRNIVDLYRYIPNSNGLANELKYPAALITADEQTFIGSGAAAVATYNRKSFLTPSYGFDYAGTGGIFTLSPYQSWMGVQQDIVSLHVYRESDRYGGMGNLHVEIPGGVRPAISLIHSTTIASGSGTATDPWLIDE